MAARAAALVLVLVLTGCAAVDERASAPGWRYAQPMSQRRSYSAAAEAAGLIYVAGGMVGNSGRFLALFQRYDPRTDSWTTLAPLPEPTRAASAASLGGKFYLTGGQRPSREGRRVDIYDIRRGAWSRGALLPVPRFNHSTVALGGKLYVLGGLAGKKERQDVFVYDPKAAHWTRAAPLPRPSHAFGAVAFRGEIWTIGGLRGERTLRDVWIYNPRADRWRAGPALPRPMALLGAAANDHRVHAVVESTYQIYDARAGMWRSGPRPLVRRHALTAFAVDQRLYTIGGCRTPELVDTQTVEVTDLDMRGSRTAIR
jgi:hypothetical protein